MENGRPYNLQVEPQALSGSIAAIPSKSYAQRIFIAASLCDKPTKIALEPQFMSGDIYATLLALESAGSAFDVSFDDNSVEIFPNSTLSADEASPASAELDSPSPAIPTLDASSHEAQNIVNCEESGTAARLLLPVLTALHDQGTLTGTGSLLKRPFETLCKSLEQGEAVQFDQYKLPLSWKGQLQSGHYQLPGDESSQYISGLLFALPLLEGESTVELTSPLQSVGYIDMTLDVLAQFGIIIDHDGANRYHIKGGQSYQSPGTIEVEGDWSNSAFWLAANVEVAGLNPDSLQRDRLFLELKDKQHIDATDVPDLVPILSVYAALKKGTTTITGIERLRIKESDRIKTTFALLDALGCKVELGPIDETWTPVDELDPLDEEAMYKEWENHKLALIVHGTGSIPGGAKVNGANDHRIVMAAAIAGSFADAPVTILGAQAVAKTYAHFFEDFCTLGGRVKRRPAGLLGSLLGYH